MATLNTETNLYELDDKVVLGLHLGAGASDLYLIEADNVIYTTQDSKAISVQDAIGSIYTYVGSDAILVSETDSNTDSESDSDSTSSIKTISLVIDSDSESYLSQSESGLKLSGIDDAINSLTADDISASKITESDGTITVSGATIGEQIADLAKSIYSVQTQLTVKSSDSTITVSSTVSGTDLSVNIDNETIINNDGVLSVADAALTQYVGEDAISVSETDSNTDSESDSDSTSSTKTISLVISGSDEILSQDENGLIANLTVEKVTEGLESENVLEQYNIVGKDNTVIGSIPVYKDRALIEVYLGTSKDTVNATTGEVTKTDATINKENAALCFVYQLADGSYSIVAIDVSSFLYESEFGDGLQVADGVVSVLIDSDSESYLSVDENGLKLSGIDDAISSAINALDVTEIGGKGYMITTISETNGVIAATIITASADNISASEIAEFDGTIAVNGTTVEEQIADLAKSIYSVQTQLTVDSSDSTITVSTGETGTDLTVNIDNETIVSNSGVLSVADAALTQYVGEDAILVSETNPNTDSESDSDSTSNTKTISLVIDSDSESYLSQSESGLKLSGIDEAINSLTADDISASEISESDGTITVSGATVGEQIESLAKSIYSVQTQLTVDSSDSTITVITGETGTDLTVNIDNETIVSNSGVLSVADAALTQYVGEDAISVSETDSNTDSESDSDSTSNTKTISLVIDSDSESYLSQSESGLKLSGIDDAIINSLVVTNNTTYLDISKKTSNTTTEYTISDEDLVSTINGLFSSASSSNTYCDDEGNILSLLSETVYFYEDDAENQYIVSRTESDNNETIYTYTDSNNNTITLDEDDVEISNYYYTDSDGNTVYVSDDDIIISSVTLYFYNPSSDDPVYNVDIDLSSIVKRLEEVETAVEGETVGVLVYSGIYTDEESLPITSGEIIEDEDNELEVNAYLVYLESKQYFIGYAEDGNWHTSWAEGTGTSLSVQVDSEDVTLIYTENNTDHEVSINEDGSYYYTIELAESEVTFNYFDEDGHELTKSSSSGTGTYSYIVCVDADDVETNYEYEYDDTEMTETEEGSGIYTCDVTGYDLSSSYSRIISGISAYSISSSSDDVYVVNDSDGTQHVLTYISDDILYYEDSDGNQYDVTITKSGVTTTYTYTDSDGNTQTIDKDDCLTTNYYYINDSGKYIYIPESDVVATRYYYINPFDSNTYYVDDTYISTDSDGNYIYTGTVAEFVIIYNSSDQDTPYAVLSNGNAYIAERDATYNNIVYMKFSVTYTDNNGEESTLTFKQYECETGSALRVSSYVSHSGNYAIETSTTIKVSDNTYVSGPTIRWLSKNSSGTYYYTVIAGSSNSNSSSLIYYHEIYYVSLSSVKTTTYTDSDSNILTKSSSTYYYYTNSDGISFKLTSSSGSYYYNTINIQYDSDGNITSTTAATITVNSNEVSSTNYYYTEYVSSDDVIIIYTYTDSNGTTYDVIYDDDSYYYIVNVDGDDVKSYYIDSSDEKHELIYNENTETYSYSVDNITLPESLYYNLWTTDSEGITTVSVRHDGVFQNLSDEQIYMYSEADGSLLDIMVLSGNSNQPIDEDDINTSFDTIVFEDGTEIPLDED